MRPSLSRYELTECTAGIEQQAGMRCAQIIVVGPVVRGLALLAIEQDEVIHIEWVVCRQRQAVIVCLCYNSYFLRKIATTDCLGRS